MSQQQGTKPPRTYAELAQSDKEEDLDEYLKKEFPDDWQTDDPKKGVLSDYVRQLFGKAKTPKAMKVEIDAVDYRVKAYYLLSLLRATEKNTNLRSAVPKPQLWKREDFLNTNNKGTVQTAKQRVTQIAGYPHMIGSNFVFNDKKLLSVYNEQVVPRVSPLWEGQTRDKAENVAGLIARLGDHYGLERIIDQLEKNPGRRPKRGNKPQGTDEEIVERNLLRFALFGAKNYVDNLTFVFSGKDDDKNVHALKIAFDDDKEPDGEKETFARTDFPEELKLAAYPFFAKAVDSIGREKIGDNLKGLKTYLTEFEKMATPYGPGMPQQTEDPEKAKAAAAAAAEAAKQVPVAAAITTDEKGQSTDVPAPPTVAETAATTSGAQDVKPVAASDVPIPGLKGNVARAALLAEKNKERLCEGLITELRQYETQVTALQAALETYNTTSSEATKLIADQQALIQTLSELKKKTGGTIDEMAAIRAQLLECNSRATTLQAEIDKLKEDQLRLQARIEALVKTINSLQGKLDEIDTLLTKVQVQSALLKNDEEIDKIKTLEQQLVERAEKIQNKIKELLDEQAKLGEQENLIKEDIRKNVDKLATIEKQGKDFEEQLRECKEGREAALESYRSFCEKQTGVLARVNTALLDATKSMEAPRQSLKEAVQKGREALLLEQKPLEAELSNVLATSTPAATIAKEKLVEGDVKNPAEAASVAVVPPSS